MNHFNQTCSDALRFHIILHDMTQDEQKKQQLQYETQTHKKAYKEHRCQAFLRVKTTVAKNRKLGISSTVSYCKQINI